MQKELMYEKGQSAGKVNVQERVQNVQQGTMYGIRTTLMWDAQRNGDNSES